MEHEQIQKPRVKHDSEIMLKVGLIVICPTVWASVGPASKALRAPKTDAR